MLTCFLLVLHFFVVFAENEGSLSTKGDILLGGLFPIHNSGAPDSKCGTFNSNPGYQYMEAMLYTLDKVNADPTILPGIKLGCVISDTCTSEVKSGKNTKKFLEIIFSPKSGNNSELLSVVGPMLGENAQTVANILRAFEIPQVSYGATSNELSNKVSFKYFFRTVAPDHYFFAALVAFLKRLGMKYVSIIHSEKIWSRLQFIVFSDALRRHGICVAKPEVTILARTTDKNIDKFIQRLLSDDKEPKIVILVTSTKDSRAMLAAKKRIPRGKELMFVAGLEWSNRMTITQDFEDVAEGTYSFGHRQGHIPEFETYFNALRYNTYPRDNKLWIGKYWQETHQCTLPDIGIPTNFNKTCTGDEDNTLFQEFAPVQLVINAVYAIVNALDSLQRRLCPNNIGICAKMRPISTTSLLEFLKNVTFEDALSHNTISFNAKQEVVGNYTVFQFRSVNGSFQYVPVGSWTGRVGSIGTITGGLVLDEAAIEWTHANAVKSLVKCRPDCSSGQVRRNHKKPQCCWDCHTCAESETVTNNTCQACEPGFTPGENSTLCLKLDVVYINMDSALAIALVALSVLGILADLVFLTAFILARHHPLIKASGIEMCYIIFVGIAAIFAIPLTILIKPTEKLCRVRVVFASISLTICYAPLLLKVWRIHGIFQRANKLKRLSSGSIFGLGPMLGLTFLLILISILYTAAVSSIDRPHVVETFYEDRQELVLECTTSATVFISTFAYNLLLLFGCTVYAFLTRNFPKNFNEAMHIGITLYLTCAVWLVFLASFVNSAYSISRDYWLSGSSLATGWVTLFGLFAPKFYHVKTKPEVGREMLIAWGESIRQRSEGTSGSCEECRRRAEALKKFNNDGSRNGSSASKIGNSVVRNDEFQEIGIHNLVDTKI